VRATLLEPSDQSQVEDLLFEAPADHIFLLGMLQRRQIGVHTDETWWGVRDEENRFVGLAFLSKGSTSAGPGLWTCAGDEAAGAVLGAVLGAAPLPAMCIGPRAMVDGLWEALGSPAHRLAASSRIYQCGQVLPGEGLDVRQCTMSDLPWLREASVAMMREDLGIDPRSTDPEAHEARLIGSIMAGRSYVGTIDKARVFRLVVGTQCSHGAQVGGTWVPPAYRGKSIGARGMRAVCALLLESMPLVVLHVQESNRPAVDCYTQIGFTPSCPLRLLVR
jgi:ribosomal protein S18 acetylase RimI-like enzyme